MRKSRGAKGAKAPKLNFSKVALRNASYTWVGVFLTVLALSGANQVCGLEPPMSQSDCAHQPLTERCHPRDIPQHLLSLYHPLAYLSLARCVAGARSERRDPFRDARLLRRPDDSPVLGPCLAPRPAS